MPTVRRREADQVGQSAPRVAYLSDAGASPDAFGGMTARALQGAGQAVENIAEAQWKKQEKRWDEENQLGVLQGDTALRDQIQQIVTEYVTTAKGARAKEQLPEVQSRIAKARQDVLGTLKNEKQRRAFLPLASERESSALGAATKHYTTEDENDYKLTSAARRDGFMADGPASYQDFEQHQKHFRGLLDQVDLDADRFGWSPDVRQREKDAARSNYLAATVKFALNNKDVGAAAGILDTSAEHIDGAVLGELTNLVTNAQQDRAALEIAQSTTYEVPTQQTNIPGGGSGGGFNVSARSLLEKEGGYVANDAGKGPTNFGINSAANPDIDVRNLTPERATQIYRERYWNPIGGDTLPPALAHVAFDAAVNQGVGNAKKWIAQSGGDIGRFTALRLAHYRSLDKYAQFGPAWEKRAAQSLAEAQGMGGATPGGPIGSPTRLLTNAERMVLAREKAGPGATPEYVQKIYTALSQQQATVAQDRAAAEADVWDRAVPYIAEGSGVMSMGDLAQRDPTLYADLLKHPTKWKAVNDHFANEAEQRANQAEQAANQPPPGAEEEYYRLTWMARHAPQEFLALKPEDYWNKVSQAQRNQLHNIRLGLTDPGKPKAPETIATGTLMAETTLLLRNAGIDPSPKGKDKQALAQLAAFQEAMRSSAAAWSAANGGKAPPPDVIRALGREHLIRGRWGDDKVFAFEAAQRERQGERAGLRIEIPKPVENALKGELRSELKREPTRAEVVAAYRRAVAAGVVDLDPKVAARGLE